MTRSAAASTRVIIGDVRGKGLAAIGEASVVLGAFREGAHRCATLPDLTAALEVSVCRDLDEVADTDDDPGEHFVTALVLDIPDDGTEAAMLNCGHPPPLLLRGREVTVLHARHPAPPLGMCGLPAASQVSDPFTFAAGDLLLLYTDGVIEARSPSGAFYPLAERLATFSASGPDALVRHIHDDLVRHVGAEPADDAALLVLERTAAHHLRLPHRAATRSGEDRRARTAGEPPARPGSAVPGGGADPARR